MIAFCIKLNVAFFHVTSSSLRMFIFVVQFRPAMLALPRKCQVQLIKFHKLMDLCPGILFVQWASEETYHLLKACFKSGTQVIPPNSYVWWSSLC